MDVAEGDPTPTLLYKQSLTQHGGATNFQLKPGKNEITIPEINYESNGIPKDVIQGEIYSLLITKVIVKREHQR